MRVERWLQFTNEMALDRVQTFERYRHKPELTVLRLTKPVSKSVIWLSIGVMSGDYAVPNV